MAGGGRIRVAFHTYIQSFVLVIALLVGGVQFIGEHERTLRVLAPRKYVGVGGHRAPEVSAFVFLDMLYCCAFDLFVVVFLFFGLISRVLRLFVSVSPSGTTAAAAERNVYVLPSLEPLTFYILYVENFQVHMVRCTSKEGVRSVGISG